MARCMMQNKLVPSRFLAEAIFTIVYLLNRSLTMAMKETTLEEAWFGRKPRVNHLKVFGSTTYASILDEKITKLEPKSRKLMLARYNDNHKAYRLIDVETNQVTYTRGVVVDKEVGPFILLHQISKLP